MRDIEKLPGNARIAVALLDVLATAGDVAGRERAERALGDVAVLGRRRADWIQSELLRKVFRETPVDERLARRIGHALAAPRQIGLLLFHAGVATPEKAYRRVDQLLARERPGDHFEAVSIEKGRARIEFHPERRSELEAVFCSVRAGMLESMGQPVLTDERGLATDTLAVDEDDEGDVVVTGTAGTLTDMVTVPVVKRVQRHRS